MRAQCEECQHGYFPFTHRVPVIAPQPADIM